MCTVDPRTPGSGVRLLRLAPCVPNVAQRLDRRTPAGKQQERRRPPRFACGRPIRWLRRAIAARSRWRARLAHPATGLGLEDDVNLASHAWEPPRAASRPLRRVHDRAARVGPHPRRRARRSLASRPRRPNPRPSLHLRSAPPFSSATTQSPQEASSDSSCRSRGCPPAPSCRCPSQSPMVSNQGRWSGSAPPSTATSSTGSR